MLRWLINKTTIYLILDDLIQLTTQLVLWEYRRSVDISIRSRTKNDDDEEENASYPLSFFSSVLLLRLFSFLALALSLSRLFMVVTSLSICNRFFVFLLPIVSQHLLFDYVFFPWHRGWHCLVRYWISIIAKKLSKNNNRSMFSSASERIPNQIRAADD